MSDLGPRTASPHSRPHRLQPLRHDSVGTRATKTKRKKTKKKDGEETERGKLEGSERGPEEISELASHSDPLLEASTLQQMQARLDPLFGGTPPPALQNGNIHSYSHDALANETYNMEIHVHSTLAMAEVGRKER